MSSWREQAVKALEDSLYPVPQELNGVDWKCALSDKSEKLAHHLCAFSNTTGGGFLTSPSTCVARISMRLISDRPGTR